MSGGLDSTTACSMPAGYVADDTDCDDAADGVSPAAAEVCGGGDENCDSAIDESTASDAEAWYTDADLDGYGDPATVTMSCTAVVGAVTDATDCDDADDADDAINIAAVETCGDGVDNDCDGAADDGCWPAGDVVLGDADLVVQGPSADAQLGGRIAGGGDLTGDGLADLALTYYDAGGTAAGYYVVSGNLTGTVAAGTSTAYLAMTGAASDDLELGDADGDGMSDVLILSMSTAWLDTGPFGLGSGPAGGRAVIDCGATGGYCVSGGFSDLDGDGSAQVILGTYRSGEYGVAVFEDPSGAFDPSTADVWWGSGGVNGCGYAMDGGEDVDGDGLEDLLVTANPTTPDSGAFAVFGPGASAGDLPDVADVTFEYAYTWFAYHAAALLPDVDGDGLADVMLGHYAYPDIYTDAPGIVRVFTGVAPGVHDLSTANASIEGTSTTTQLGSDVDAADIDQDGLSDLLLQSKYSDAWLFFGPVLGAPDTDDADNRFDELGTHGDISTGGDVEGFGFDSLVLGEHGNDDAATNAGAVYLFRGAGR